MRKTVWLSCTQRRRGGAHGATSFSLYRRAMYIREAKLGASSPQLAATMTNLSVQLARGDAEELADAERLLRRGMQIRREVYGEEHPEVAHSLHLLANL